MYVDNAFGGDFINVTHRVGKTGNFEDVMYVQIMLKFVFTRDPNFKNFLPEDFVSQFMPNGKPGKDTQRLIAAFQKNFMRRPKPEGYLDKAFGSDNHKASQTIYQIFAHTQFTIDTWVPARVDVFNLIKMGFQFAMTELKSK